MSTEADIVAAVIRRRKTEKVLGGIEGRPAVPAEVAERNRPVVLDAIKASGWAPFHYPRNVGDLAEPWRAHVVWGDGAEKLSRHLRDDLGCETKEPNLCAGCNALVLVTWLPELNEQATGAVREKQAARDAEHLAAASAMVQNLLLLLTAHGMGTYWSSGGKLRGPEAFDYLGIPAGERLLAAVFVEYPEMRDETKERVPGKQRDNRSERWLREVTL